jgi:methyl-accepting chemotaxis protein
MWWRNLRISMKLSLGFGLVLLVFLASILVMWSYVRVVVRGNDTLEMGIAPALERITTFAGHAERLFRSANTVQYTESPEAIAQFRTYVTNARAEQAGLEAMLRADPSLFAVEHVIRTAVPYGQQFVALMERSIDLIERKNSQLEIVIESGTAMSDSALNMMTFFHEYAKSRVGGLIAAYELDGTDLGEVYRLMDAQYISSQIREGIMAMMRDKWYGIADIQARGDAQRLQQVMGMVTDLLRLAEGLESLIPLINNPDIGQEYNMIMSHLREYDVKLNSFIQLSVQLVQLHQERLPAMYAFDREISRGTDISVGRVINTSAENSRDLNRSLRVMFGATLFGVLLSLGVGFFIARSISLPLNTIVNLAKRAGEGDLTIKKSDFGYDGKDEMGNMITALSGMIESQDSVLSKVVKISGELASGADNLSSIAEKTSVAMEEVKTSVTHVGKLSESNGSSLEQSNAGIEEMSAGADTVARAATDSATFIAQTTDASNKAIKTVNSVIDGMRNVDRNSKGSEEKNPPTGFVRL